MFRELKSFQAAFLPLVQELREGYRLGHPVRDHSRLDSRDADFYMRSVLLFCNGDYPGQAKHCNMSHKGERGCHNCHQFFEKLLGTSGNQAGINNRARLPREHYMRDDDMYGVDSNNPGSCASRKPNCAQS